jgi:hypothetical protein
MSAVPAGAAELDPAAPIWLILRAAASRIQNLRVAVREAVMTVRLPALLFRQGGMLSRLGG